VANATTDTELIGIKIAATMGDRFPEMANEEEELAKWPKKSKEEK